MTPDARGHTFSVRRFLGNIVVAWVALLFWPVTAALAVALLIRRVFRRQWRITEADAEWFVRKFGLGLAAIAIYLLIGAVASIFISIPDI